MKLEIWMESIRLIIPISLSVGSSWMSHFWVCLSVSLFSSSHEESWHWWFVIEYSIQIAMKYQSNLSVQLISVFVKCWFKLISVALVLWSERFLSSSSSSAVSIEVISIQRRVKPIKLDSLHLFSFDISVGKTLRVDTERCAASSINIRHFDRPIHELSRKPRKWWQMWK